MNFVKFNKCTYLNRAFWKLISALTKSKKSLFRVKFYTNNNISILTFCFKFKIEPRSWHAEHVCITIKHRLIELVISNSN